jgi:hypothetical protein
LAELQLHKTPRPAGIHQIAEAHRPQPRSRCAVASLMEVLLGACCWGYCDTRYHNYVLRKEKPTSELRPIRDCHCLYTRGSIRRGTCAERHRRRTGVHHSVPPVQLANEHPIRMIFNPRNFTSSPGLHLASGDDCSNTATASASGVQSSKSRE